MSDKPTEDLVISYADLVQFQFTYSREEDRILIDFQGTQNQCYRAWVSRLFIRKAWSIFLQVLQQGESLISPISLDNPKEELDLGDKRVEKRFEHQDNIVPQIEFLGEENEGLIHTLHIEAKNAPILEIKLLNKEDRGILVHLSYTLFQVFCGLIAETVQHAKWGLQLENADWVIKLNETDEDPQQTIH